MDIFFEVIGWVGSLEIIAAYGLNVYQKIRSDSLAYFILNFTGGVFLIIYTVWKEAYASTFINIVWVLIATVAIVRFFSTKR